MEATAWDRYPDLTVGLTMSGGGVRGMAHVGMLRALLEGGIVPKKVVGVSAGAIVGTLYCAGLLPDEMMTHVSDTSLRRLIKWGLPTTGLTTLDHLRERIRQTIPHNSFSGLKHPLYIGITNLNAGALEIRNDGPLDAVLAASCSIPLVFKPVVIGDDNFVDGGVMKNMPVSPLLQSTDFIIGSNLMPYGLLPTDSTGTVINIVWRCFDLAIMANTQPTLDLCDVVIEPARLLDYNIFNIVKLRELHDLGYEHTRERLPDIYRKLDAKAELLRELTQI